jgi:WD40 repeat protein
VSWVDWIEQIKDGTLISCLRDKTIRLYSIDDKSYKNISITYEPSSAWKMKELECGKLISTMSNNDIKIWIKNYNSLECQFTLKNGGESYDILEIRKNEVVAFSENNLNFYDLNKRDKICSIPGFEKPKYNPGQKFCQANEELLLVCGNKYIFLVDYKEYKLIGKIKCDGIITTYKSSNNFIFSGQYNGQINQWKCNGKELKLYSYKKKAHNHGVFSMLILNNVFISSDKSSLKIWESK